MLAQQNMLLTDRTGVGARTPMPVSDVTIAGQSTSITGESVSFADGAAGTTQKLKLEFDKVMSAYGDRIGTVGDTSLSFTTGAVLTTEKPWKFKDTGGQDTDALRLATLSNGEYMVDYENGYILGKSATATSSTTDTVAYKIRKSTATLTGDIQIGAVELKDGSSDQRGSIASNGGVNTNRKMASSFDHGSKELISTNATQLTSTSFSAILGVLVKAHKNNSGRVFIGNADVTADTEESTDGIPLEAGESVVLEINDPSLLYGIADGDNHKVYWVAL